MNDGYIQLKNDRLTVEIAKPGTAYAGSRFDWTGFMTQVWLDNKHTFGAYESIIPGEGSGGIGFCNDFGLDHPIGYDEADVGEGYLKVGVGTVLKYDNRPRDCVQMLNLKIAERAQISFAHTETEASFCAVNPEINGYQCELRKRISLSDNCIQVAYVLKNTGRKPIHTEEYLHNFLCIDGQYLGPNYRIYMALKPSAEMMENSSRIQPEMIFTKNYISFSRVYEGEAFFLKGYTIVPEQEYSWKIWEKTTGCSVCEIDSFVPHCMSVWGTKYAAAPEAFKQIDLAPNEKCSWVRVLKFESGEMEGKNRERDGKNK